MTKKPKKKLAVKTSGIRKSAHDILMQVEYSGGYSDELINSRFAEINDPRDFKLLRKLVLGVLERRNTLDYIIGKHSNTAISKLNKDILEILRTSIYQLVFLDSIPDYAVINEAVEMSKSYAFKGISRFVNGILRSVVKTFTIGVLDLSELNLNEKYNLNDEIVAYLIESYGEETALELMEGMYEELPMSIRVNTSKISVENAKEALVRSGLKVVDSSLTKCGLLISNPFAVHRHKLYTKGLISIQGEGSSIAVEAMDIQKTDKVLDLCAAPGTKSTQIAESLGEGGRLVCNDIDKKRHNKIDENMRRIGYENYEITGFDGSIINAGFEACFDKVLVDAPCSSLGLIARKPEIRYRRTIDEIVELSKLQKRILDNAITYLRPGGTLVYSTCTYGTYENEEQIKYLVDSKGLKTVPIKILNGTERPFIQLFNNNDRADGFFVSMFKK